MESTTQASEPAVNIGGTKEIQRAAEALTTGDGTQIGPVISPSDARSDPIDEVLKEDYSHSSSSSGSAEEQQEDVIDDSPPKPQPNLNKAGLKMPDFFDQLESQWVGSFNQRMSVPYKEYEAQSVLGKISWQEYALIENEENIRKGHHAVCPQVRCRKSGSVYRCKIVSCARIYFNLTTLGFKLEEYEEEIRTYLMERQFLFSFDHPFVRSGLGYFTDSNYNFGVLLEEFPHGTLMDYYEKLESGKIVSRFTEEQVRMLAAQMILALEYLHCIGCIHRDIQASNVLVDSRGYVKLTDFAITATVKPGEKLNSVTCFRYYAAPEYFNDKGYSYPVDFYALGLMLYELLTQECFTDQEDIFDCDGSVDWGILPDELAALLKERRQTELDSSSAYPASQEAPSSNSNSEPQSQQPQLPFDHFVPSEAARGFVDDCLIYEPEFRPDRNSARFYDWFDEIDFERLYCKTLDLPWRPGKVVSYQAGPEEEYPLQLVLDEKPVPESLLQFRHLL